MARFVWPSGYSRSPGRVFSVGVSTMASLLTVALSTATVAFAQIPAGEFAVRRDSLAARIDSGVVVAFGGRALVHDFSTFYQLPAFRYLTNFEEPDAALVIVVRNRKAQSTLYVTPLDGRTAFYYGKRVDSTTSEKLFGMKGRSFAALSGVLDSLAGTGLPFFDVPDVETMDFSKADSLTRGQEAMKNIRRKFPTLAVRNAMPHILQLRGRKSAAEMALIKKAAEISSEGHRSAMLTANPMHEYELRASLGYAADITRTIPVSGTFTTEQKQIYQLVRDAQAVAERNSKAGMRIKGAIDSSVFVRARGLAALGLVESEDATFDPPWTVNCAQQPSACRQSNLWMIHGITHGIGLAVHDPIQGNAATGTFAMGDAFTIEPGIYISTRALDVLPDTPKNRAFIAKVRATVLRYQNTGVRIEDDYIITDTGLERISLVPREISEIEALMKQRRVITP